MKKKTIEIVLYIRIRYRDLNHRKGKEFLSKLYCQYYDIIYHTEVKQIRKG